MVPRYYVDCHIALGQTGPTQRRTPDQVGQQRLSRAEERNRYRGRRWPIVAQRSKMRFENPNLFEPETVEVEHRSGVRRNTKRRLEPPPQYSPRLAKPAGALKRNHLVAKTSRCVSEDPVKGRYRIA